MKRMDKQMIKQEVAELFNTYKNIPIDFSSRAKVYQPSCNEVTDVLRENQNNEQFIKMMLEENYADEIQDFYDLLKYASSHNALAEKTLYEFCLNKIKENKDDSEIILKNVRILSNADIDFSEIVREYGYFVKDSYEKMYLHILDKSLRYLDYKQWNIDEEKIGTYFINELISSNSRRFGSDSELNKKIIDTIKSMKHSMFDEHKKGCSYNKNMLIECIKEEKYNILISLISESKKKKKPVSDTASYLGMYIKQLNLRDKHINDKIFSFLLDNSKTESLLGKTIYDNDNFLSIIKKSFFIESNEIILNSIMKKHYNPSFKPLVERLVKDEQLNTKIKIKSKTGENKEISVGQLLKRWTKNHPGVFSYIEKWELTETLKETEEKLEPVVKKRL